MNPAPPVTSALIAVADALGRHAGAGEPRCRPRSRRRADDRPVGGDRRRLEDAAGRSRRRRPRLVRDAGAGRAAPTRTTLAPVSTDARRRRAPSRRTRAPDATRRPAPRSTGGSTSRIGGDRDVALHPDARAPPRPRRATGGAPSAPASTSAWACRYFSGVPMSIQYASLCEREQAAGLVEHARERLALDRDGQAAAGCGRAPTARARRCRR